MIRVVTCQTLKGIDFVLCTGHLARSCMRLEWFFLFVGSVETQSARQFRCRRHLND